MHYTTTHQLPIKALIVFDNRMWNYSYRWLLCLRP